MHRVTRSILQGAILGFLLVPAGFAQSTFGSITGAVKDPSGAVIPGAEITVTNTGTGSVRRANSTSGGLFSVPNLDVGTYSVRVAVKGFNTYDRENLVLMANQIINVDVNLKLGTSAESVEVNAPSPIISTESNDITGSIRGEAAEALPLIARHAADYGVYTYTTLSTGMANNANSSYPIFQGTRSGTGVMSTMDGISIAAYAQGAGPVSMGLSLVQEIKVETSVAPAEFPTAGNVQVISKSGTNSFHGEAFEDYNGNSLNARNFFSPTVPWRVYNNFGVAGGGPVIKNKVFFYADYEAAREAARGTKTETVPLAAWRTGNFSGTSTVRDPLTGQPFPGNVIPDSRISPVSKAVQDYIYPLPNVGGPGLLTNNWTKNVLSQTGFTRYNRVDVRGDYNISSKDTLFGRVSWMRMPYYSAGVFPLARNQTRFAQSAMVSYNHVISPNAVNELRVGAVYHRNQIDANVNGTDLLNQFGIKGVPTTGILTAPYFGITGLTAFDPGSGTDIHYDNPDTSFDVLDNVSWTHGRHMMKFGFDALTERFNGNSIGATVYGQYNFTGAYTGVGYSDFLLGIPATTALSLPGPDRALRGKTFGLYAQDQYRITNALTLTLGIRWELPRPYTDARGQLFTYNPATGGLVVPDQGLKLVNPFYPKNIPIATASQAGYPDSLVKADTFNLQPRIGFAYKMFGSDKTVLRGGYGIYSNLIYPLLTAGAMTGGPFGGSVTYFNSVTNGVPLFSFPSPFLPTGTTATQNVSGINPNLRMPYTQQWNMSLERQIGSYGLRASYVGSRSIALLYPRNLNEPAPSTTPFSTARFPNQLFNSITYYDNGGSDFYSALELQVQKKLGKNLTFSSGFTWAKDLTDAQDTGGGGGSFAGQSIQDQFCRTCERSNNQLVPGRRLYGYAVYALPVGHGQKYMGSANRVLDAILGGWQTSYTLVIQSGQYFTPSFSTFTPSNTGVIGGVPDRVVGVPLYPDHQDVNHWFNPAAFAVPGCMATTPVCSNPVNVGRFGTSGWNYLVGPPLKNLDFGASKAFRLRERTYLQFMMTMSNAFNHPSFTTPNANISTPSSVGVISGIRGALSGQPSARNIDFILKLSF